MSYARAYNPETGRLIGVLLDGATLIPRDAANKDWREFLVWNEQQQPPLDLSDLQPPTAAERTAALRAAADALLASDVSAASKLARAVVLTVIDEINALRQRLRAQDAAVAAAASLADLKARWSALPALPDRTGAQARSAVQAHLDAGDAD